MATRIEKHQQHLATTSNLSGKGVEMVSLKVMSFPKLPKVTLQYHAQVIVLFSYAGLGNEHRRF
jgi:hypothetical protein